MLLIYYIEFVLPGPCDYAVKALIDGTGIAYNSLIKSSLSKSMGLKLRKPINKYPSKFLNKKN